MARLFHVTSSRNRDSIEQHGLDWRYMGAASGIAGSPRPEVEGVFVCRGDFETEFFLRMNATNGPVDVWEIDGVEAHDLIESDEGFEYVPRSIPRSSLTLVRRAIASDDASASIDRDGGAYSSTLTIGLADGTVLTGEAADEFTAPRQSPTA